MRASPHHLRGLIGGGACKQAPCAGSVGIAAVPVQAKDGAAKGVVSGAGGVAGGPGGWTLGLQAGGFAMEGNSLSIIVGRAVRGSLLRITLGLRRLAELFRSTQELIAVLQRPKLLVTPVVWVQPVTKLGQRQMTLTSSLWDGTATIQGVRFSASCSPEGFDLPVHVTLLAEFRGKPRAIARVDINGQRHENRHKVCGSLQFSDAGVTHFHDTSLHADIEIAQLLGGSLGDLPIARPIGDMPEDFSKAMEKCGELLHIGNLTEIEEPQWQPRQFPF